MKKTLAYWIPTALFSLAMMASGGAALAGIPEAVETYARLGFPGWFPTWLGTFKLLGVGVLLAPGLPRLKEWAYAGFFINLTSAAAAHAAAGDAVGDSIAPVLMLAIALTSWHFRPEGRRLAGGLV